MTSPGSTEGVGPVPTYSRQEAARLLGVSVDWLRAHLAELPHLRMGRKIQFTAAHLAKIQQDREVQPTRPAHQAAESRIIRRRRRMPTDWRAIP